MFMLSLVSMSGNLKKTANLHLHLVEQLFIFLPNLSNSDIISNASLQTVKLVFF